MGHRGAGAGRPVVKGGPDRSQASYRSRSRANRGELLWGGLRRGLDFLEELLADEDVAVVVLGRRHELAESLEVRFALHEDG